MELTETITPSHAAPTTRMPVVITEQLDPNLGTREAPVTATERAVLAQVKETVDRGEPDEARPAPKAEKKLSLKPREKAEAAGDTPAETKAEPTAATEEAKADKPEEPTKKAELDRLAKGFAALTKKDREVKAKERALSEREASIADMAKARELAKSNPIAALEALGWSYKDATEFVLADGKPNPNREVQALREEMAAKEAREREAKRLEEEAQTQRTIDTYKRNIAGFIAQNSDTYELIHTQGASELVWDVIEAHYAQTGHVLATEDAAKHVEDHLEGEVRKLLATKKFSSGAAKPEPKAERPRGTNGRFAPEPEDEPATVTGNRFRATPQPKTKPLSRDEKLERMASMLRKKA